MTAQIVPLGSDSGEVADPQLTAHHARTAWYEERKRDLIMAVLPWRFFQLAVEPGCGSGLITTALAARCGRVLAWDRDESVVAECRAKTAGLTNVEVGHGELPADWPDETADLVVLSEVGYHLTPRVLDGLVARACAGLAAGGTLVAAHRRDPGPSFTLNGDDVHTHLFGRGGLIRIGGYADDELRIDVFEAMSPSAGREAD
jgi:SAM-dependent methyltransferase